MVHLFGLAIEIYYDARPYIRPITHLYVRVGNLVSIKGTDLGCLIFRSKFFVNTDMRRLTTGIPSEKCVVRLFRRCANAIECTHTNLDSIACYSPRVYGIAYCCWATNLYSMLLY